jgi:hypothetical protein
MSYRAQPEACGQAIDKRVGTKKEDVFSLKDLRGDQELEVLPPGGRSEELFFPVD